MLSHTERQALWNAAYFGFMALVLAIGLAFTDSQVFAWCGGFCTVCGLCFALEAETERRLRVRLEEQRAYWLATDDDRDW